MEDQELVNVTVKRRLLSRVSGFKEIVYGNVFRPVQWRG